MSNIAGTTRAQTKFLRSFRTSPFGPGVDEWPSLAILRRWMRRPGFIQAMRTLKTAMIYQSDFQLLSVAASASQVLHTTVTAGSDDDSRAKQIQVLAGLLKLAHLRQRFKAPEPNLTPEFDPFDALNLINKDLTVGRALELFEEMREQDARRAAEQEELLR